VARRRSRAPPVILRWTDSSTPAKSRAAFHVDRCQCVARLSRLHGANSCCWQKIRTSKRCRSAEEHSLTSDRQPAARSHQDWCYQQRRSLATPQAPEASTFAVTVTVLARDHTKKATQTSTHGGESLLSSPHALPNASSGAPYNAPNQHARANPAAFFSLTQLRPAGDSCSAAAPASSSGAFGGTPTLSGNVQPSPSLSLITSKPQQIRDTDMCGRLPGWDPWHLRMSRL